MQFAQMGAVFATRPLRHRATPRSALLSIGEEPTKGNPLVKETHKLLAAGDWSAAERRRRSSATSRAATS